MNWRDPEPHEEQGYVDYWTFKTGVILGQALRFRPWKEYILKPTGERVRIVAISPSLESFIKVRVRVVGAPDFHIFSVSPDQLKEVE